MLGDFINRGLIMILGYAYPAFECFKTVEKNKVDIKELRFWCQYWMIIAAIAVVERFGDFFISWLPFYGEMKLVFIVYLWHPKTMGSTYVYAGLFKPFLAKHEADVDKKIQELKLRAWDLTLHYSQNFAHHGQAAFYNMMQFMLTQSYKAKAMNMQQNAASQPKSTYGQHQRPVTDSETATPKSASRRWPPADLKGGSQTELGEDEMTDSPKSGVKTEKSKLDTIGSTKLRKVSKSTQ